MARARLLEFNYLPAAAPAIYEADGRQFVVITAAGRAKFGGKSGLGDAYVAFALPK